MTVYQLVPSTAKSQTFSPTFDGNTYNCSILWNLFAQRYYIYCTDQYNNVVFNIPLIQSIPGFALSTLVWNSASLLTTVTTVNNIGFPINSNVPITISGNSQSAYNGTFNTLITGQNSFQFTLQANPGQSTEPGIGYYYINLIAGYFKTSTMIYINNYLQVSP
jgi:hypothetical protein